MDVTLLVVGGKHDGKTIPVAGPKFVVGRSLDCHLRLQSGMISRQHCALSMRDNIVLLEDCKSTNGTFVNGQRIEEPQELKTGDRIKVGTMEFEVQMSGAAVAASAKKPQPAAQLAAEATPKNIVAKASASADDVDLSDWLSDDEEPDIAPPPPRRSNTDTSAGRTMIDTVQIAAKGAIEPMKDAPTKEMNPETKKLESAKPASANAQTAAQDLLRRVLSKPKS